MAILAFNGPSGGTYMAGESFLDEGKEAFDGGFEGDKGVGAVEAFIRVVEDILS